jgi:lipoate-protein ligase B
MPLNLIDLGLTDFASAWQKQREVFLSVRDGALGPSVIFCQHYPVITLGRQAKKNNILISESELKNKGIQLFKIERGGEVTYHGRGQLIAWPILDLGLFKKDIHAFLRYLEELVIDLLSDFGIRGERRAGLTGVWVEKRKIASIGIAIKSWISFHGLSINIKEEDLANFKLIRPCGMDIEMTSLERELGRQVEIDSVKTNLMQKVRHSLEVRVL